MAPISNILRIDDSIIEENDGRLKISPVSLLQRKNSMPHDYRTLAFSSKAHANSVLGELSLHGVVLFNLLCNSPDNVNVP